MPSVLHCSRNVLVLFGLASEIQKAHFLQPVNKWFLRTFLYLPTFLQSNAWDFCPVMTMIFENAPATSKDFQQFSKNFRKLPNTSEDVLTTIEHFWSLFNDLYKHVLIVLGHKFIIQCLLGIFLWKFWIFANNQASKNNLTRFVSQVWKIALDAWDWYL